MTNKQKQLIKDFSHDNSGLLIIVADPNTNEVFTAHKDKLVFVKVQSRLKSPIKDLLRKGRFGSAIGIFFSVLLDVLGVPAGLCKELFSGITDNFRNLNKITEPIAADISLTPAIPNHKGHQKK